MKKFIMLSLCLLSVLSVIGLPTTMHMVNASGVRLNYSVEYKEANSNTNFNSFGGVLDQGGQASFPDLPTQPRYSVIAVTLQNKKNTHKVYELNWPNIDQQAKHQDRDKSELVIHIDGKGNIQFPRQRLLGDPTVKERK